MKVSRMLQESFEYVYNRFQGSFNKDSRVFQGSFKCALVRFQVCLRVLQENSKGAGRLKAILRFF